MVFHERMYENWIFQHKRRANYCKFPGQDTFLRSGRAVYPTPQTRCDLHKRGDYGCST